MKLITVILELALVSWGSSFLQDEHLNIVLEPGEKIEKLSDGFLFTEGPSADKDGNVYFTDQPNNRIMKWSITGELSTFMQPCGRSNGLAFDKDGNLWSCADEKNELWRIDKDKKIIVFPSKYNGKVLNGPNDLWITPSGGVFFTDPFYKRTWWDHSEKPQEQQGVYFLNPENKTIIRVASDLEQPNGIVGTPDGKKLFISDIGAKKTWSFKVEKDFTLTDKKLFCEMGSDGMTLDVNGNLYLTGNGVTIFDKNGKQIGKISVPENWTANVCFGSKDMKSLFITATKGLYKIRMKVKGTGS